MTMTIDIWFRKRKSWLWQRSAEEAYNRRQSSGKATFWKSVYRGKTASKMKWNVLSSLTGRCLATAHLAELWMKAANKMLSMTAC